MKTTQIVMQARVPTAEEVQEALEKQIHGDQEGIEFRGYIEYPRSRAITFHSSEQLAEVRIVADTNYVSERRYMASYKWSWALKKLVRSFEWTFTTVKLDKKGQLVVYRGLTRQNRVYNITYTWDNHNAGLTPDFHAALNKTFGHVSRRIIAERRPELLKFKHASTIDMKDGVSHDLYKHLRDIFGEKYNKGVLKAYGSVIHHYKYREWKELAYWGAQVAGSFPIEWVMEKVRSLPNPDDLNYAGWEGNTLSSYFSKRRIFDLLTSGNIVYVARDLISLQMRLEEQHIEVQMPRNPSNTEIQRLHDEWARMLARARVADKPIKQIKAATLIDKMVIPGTTLVVETAKSTHQMVDWGNTMHNCIGMYTLNALNGEALYFSLMDGEKIVANAEVRNGALIQLLGNRNESLDPEIYTAVKDYLIFTEVITDPSYRTWGAPQEGGE